MFFLQDMFVLILTLFSLKILQLDSSLNLTAVKKFLSFSLFIGHINIYCGEIFRIYRYKTNLCQRHKQSPVYLYYKGRLCDQVHNLTAASHTYIFIFKMTRGFWLEECLAEPGLKNFLAKSKVHSNPARKQV